MSQRTPHVAATFQTNQYFLGELLKACHTGTLQLPDFQRSWVWDEERIKSLISSISEAFPIGALMTLQQGGEVEFKPRTIQGAPTSSASTTPQSLLLDGQQRMTSMYQVSMRNKVVDTITPRNKRVKRWFYIDIEKALDDTVDRDEAIVSIPESKQVTTNFGKDVRLDLSTRTGEFEAMMYPVSMVFDWTTWHMEFINWAMKDSERMPTLLALINEFHQKVIKNFEQYQVPVIALDSGTSKEAVCVVFEKVNTGGKALDAFELVAAMYAADGYELRKDWYGDGTTPGLHQRFTSALQAPSTNGGILSNVANTDFLHVISLFHTRDKRREAEAQAKSGKELPQVIGNRQALLNLPLTAYTNYKDLAEQGFLRAAKFLYKLHIFRTYDLPYQSQIIPLAAILADLGDQWDNGTYHQKIARWYWNGVFGELYGSATESRIARDFMEVIPWLKDENQPLPWTISETSVRADRLKTMRMRLSAAYKGVNALLMLEGARDFQTGQAFDLSVFFGENTDIHHIFPRDWCRKRGIPPGTYDSIINKTPLGSRTNRTIGGAAPSEYLQRLTVGTASNPAIAQPDLNAFLQSHLINPEILWRDDFDQFMEDRQRRLALMIENAIGHSLVSDGTSDDDEFVELDSDSSEAEMTMVTA